MSTKTTTTTTAAPTSSANHSGGGGGGNSGADNNRSNGGNDNIMGISLVETEFNRIKDHNGWHMLYQEIREKCDREANEKHFGTTESEKPQNRCLNRYRDVNPYDHSRIIIHRGKVDYINANLVKLERADRKYILTQGPLSDTVGHFWLMVWEQQTKAILMLNKLMEKKQIKCHLYWPEKKGPEYALQLNEVNLTVEYLRCEEYKNYCRRWFKLTDHESKQSREIIQFHYTTWPDFGIPSSPVAFLQFLKHVRDSGALDPDVGPAVVHCSAGIGRSGTFCLVDCCLVLIDKEGENTVSVQDVLYELRRYRMGLIQTADQLYFSYQAIIKGIKLLKDTTFLDYKETPIITNENQKQDTINLDETPPPLPPRTHSLLPLAGSGAGGVLTLNLRSSTQNKPLPKIPTSESFNDDLYAVDHKHKDALNNFINKEKSAEILSNRPLPPLPTTQQQNNSLDRVHESESDENEFYEDDDDDDDDSSDVELVVEQLDEDDDDKDDEGASNESNGNNQSAEHAFETATKDAAKRMANDVKSMANGIDATNSNLNSPENELKRRKRVERQANIEQKVNEIKRKQREVDEGKQTAKKRRSLVKYIAAGVIVGVICVYAYTKLT